MTMFAGAVWKCSLALSIYTWKPAEVLYIIFPFKFSFVKTKTNIVNKRRKKN